MFKVSEKIIELLGQEIKVIDEKEVFTLGLNTSDLRIPYCAFIESEEFLSDMNPNVRMILTNERVANIIKQNDQFGFCIVDNPRLTFFKLHNALERCNDYTREIEKNHISESAIVSPLAVIAENNVSIGDNTVIEEFAVIRENTTIGNNCIIRSGVKLGGSDFEFKREGDRIFGVNHYGGVLIGDNVEIQYNTGINKALYPWDNTIIGDYSKVDMLVHIAHGVKIGKSCMIVANSGVGGRTVIGDNCWIGFACTIKNGLSIGNNARINMGAVVTKSVNDNEAVSGNFAIEHTKFIKHIKNISE